MPHLSDPPEADFSFLPPGSATLRALAPDRPLGWHDYADIWLPGPLGRFLDYGCGRGGMLKRVIHRCSECWGVDVDEELLPSELPGARFQPIQSGSPLPFADGFFDTIAILDVIEHVADERKTLSELARVLAPGGRLLLTTPHKGLLTFLDPGNAKFVAPRLHRFVHQRILGNAAHYNQLFGQERREQRGMIADFTTDQDAWHRHYRYADIMRFVPPSLETVAREVYYPGMRACWCMQIAARMLTRGRFAQTPWPFNRWAHWASRRRTSLGDQLVILFRKR